jgi:hypothetical protein
MADREPVDVTNLDRYGARSCRGAGRGTCSPPGRPGRRSRSSWGRRDRTGGRMPRGSGALGRGELYFTSGAGTRPRRGRTYDDDRAAPGLGWLPQYPRPGLSPAAGGRVTRWGGGPLRRPRQPDPGPAGRRCGRTASARSSTSATTRSARTPPAPTGWPSSTSRAHYTLEQGFVCLLNRLVDGISRRGRPAVGRALTANWGVLVAESARRHQQLLDRAEVRQDPTGWRPRSGGK